MTLTKEAAIEELKTIEDPELHIDVWTLGLIRDIDLKSKKETKITMTLTSPACPYAPVLMDAVKYALENKGFPETKIELTFDPPWEPSDDIKMMLGLT
tara:strand:- start:3007 stop:3300 length:294 start_codon:yes stop_codon:yes gene_type:complete